MKINNPKVIFVKELIINIAFAVFLFPLAVMPLINPLYSFCYSYDVQDMNELKRRIIISALIVLANLVAVITVSVLLACRKRKKRLYHASNGCDTPKRKICGLYLHKIPRNIALVIASLAIIGGIGSSIKDKTDTAEEIFILAGAISMSVAVFAALYIIKGMRTMCGKCRCFFFLEHCGEDVPIDTRAALGKVTVDVYQGRKYIDNNGKEYSVYNTEERLGLVNRTIYRANCRCKYCGKNYFWLYGRKG